MLQASNDKSEALNLKESTENILQLLREVRLLNSMKNDVVDRSIKSIQKQVIRCLVDLFKRDIESIVAVIKQDPKSQHKQRYVRAANDPIIRGKLFKITNRCT